MALGRRSKWIKCILLTMWPGVEHQGQEDEARAGMGRTLSVLGVQLPRGRAPSLFDK